MKFSFCIVEDFNAQLLPCTTEIKERTMTLSANDAGFSAFPYLWFVGTDSMFNLFSELVGLRV
jgi:hypothetical protein